MKPWEAIRLAGPPSTGLALTCRHDDSPAVERRQNYAETATLVERARSRFWLLITSPPCLPVSGLNATTNRDDYARLSSLSNARVDEYTV